MQAIRNALLAVFTVLATAVPAVAQTDTVSNSPGLFPVWFAILVVGVIVFVVATSLSVRSGK